MKEWSQMMSDGYSARSDKYNKKASKSMKTGCPEWPYRMM